uniref:Uncharacterized protein n=1 Tax=Schistocephalus solidus TaxID=70667 RepID=A0A0X3P835_SCHSO
MTSSNLESILSMVTIRSDPSSMDRNFLFSSSTRAFSLSSYSCLLVRVSIIFSEKCETKYSSRSFLVSQFHASFIKTSGGSNACSTTISGRESGDFKAKVDRRRCLRTHLR